MRPQFHLTAETGWMNDPHAITFRNGRYEVFYQYVPEPWSGRRTATGPTRSART